MKFNRVYHPVELWEEIGHGMWSISTKNKQDLLEKAIAFTGNHKLYGSFMIRVVKEWPISCENALTDYSINRKAWIGHAASALAINVSEDIVRKAWGYLTDEQRFLANKEAERAIREWELSYAKSKKIHFNMGESML